MKNLPVLAYAMGWVIGCGCGLVWATYYHTGETSQFEQKLATKQLQIDLTIASNQECRSILGEIIGEFKIEPLPITIED